MKITHTNPPQIGVSELHALTHYDPISECNSDPSAGLTMPHASVRSIMSCNSHAISPTAAITTKFDRTQEHFFTGCVTDRCGNNETREAFFWLYSSRILPSTG